MKKIVSAQQGFTHFLILVLVVIGILGFLLVSNTFSFKDRLFNNLFPKPSSHAAITDSFDDHMGVAGSSLGYKDLSNIGARWIYHWDSSLAGFPQGMFKSGAYHAPATFRLGYRSWNEQGFYFGDYGC